MSKSARSVQGLVVSNKMMKTIVVTVVRTSVDPLYGKAVKKTKKFKVHHECDVAPAVGSKVEIRESRPRSKEKTWELVRVIEVAA